MIKLTIHFYISLSLMLILFFLPTYLTYQSTALGGTMIHGFPFPFLIDKIQCVDPCKNNINFGFLLLDILFIVITPLVVNRSLLNAKKRQEEEFF